MIKAVYKKVLYISVGILLISVTFIHSCEKFACAGLRAQPHMNIEAAFNVPNIVPMLVLGSGPAGWGAASYGVWSKIKTVLIGGPRHGGLLTTTSYVENFPGYESILGADIVGNLEKFVDNLGSRFSSATNGSSMFDLIDHDEVVKIDTNSWPYHVTTKKGLEMNALTIVIATGANPKMLGIPGEKEYEKKGVATCAVCDGAAYKDKNVVVVGGGRFGY